MKEFKPLFYQVVKNLAPDIPDVNRVIRDQVIFNSSNSVRKKRKTTDFSIDHDPDVFEISLEEMMNSII